MIPLLHQRGPGTHRIPSSMLVELDHRLKSMVFLPRAQGRQHGVSETVTPPCRMLTGWGGLSPQHRVQLQTRARRQYLVIIELPTHRRWIGVGWPMPITRRSRPLTRRSRSFHQQTFRLNWEHLVRFFVRCQPRKTLGVEFRLNGNVICTFDDS